VPEYLSLVDYSPSMTRLHRAPPGVAVGAVAVTIAVNDIDDNNGMDVTATATAQVVTTGDAAAGARWGGGAYGGGVLQPWWAAEVIMRVAPW